MLKRTISFVDIDGNKVSEEFYFNVAREDMIELMVEKPEMEDKLQAMVDSMDGRSIDSLLKEFILLGVGRRPEGTRQFVKNEEVTNDFRYSGAYGQLLWELANDPTLAEEFMEGIFPPSLLDEMKQHGSIEDIRAKIAARKGETIVNLPDKDPAAKPIPHPLTAAEDGTEELPDSGRIDTVEGEVSDPRSPFPNSLPTAVAAQGTPREGVEDDRPAWLRELREPTNKELLAMDKAEMALAFKMREEGKLNTMNKPAS